jgi:hypothetical protein
LAVLKREGEGGLFESLEGDVERRLGETQTTVGDPNTVGSEARVVEGCGRLLDSPGAVSYKSASIPNNPHH